MATHGTKCDGCGLRIWFWQWSYRTRDGRDFHIKCFGDMVKKSNTQYSIERREREKAKGYVKLHDSISPKERKLLKAYLENLRRGML